MNRLTTITIAFYFLFSVCSGKSSLPYKYLIVNGVSAKTESFKEIRDVFGEAGKGKIKLGIGFIISYLRMSPEEAASQLKQYLSLSEQFELPVIVQIDGEQWWNNRPDLWNWWDESIPGYNPENRKNVEWTGWTPDSAVKIGWRNWGRQLRVLPMPNLMSPTYREACHAEMKKLVPIVMRWWNNLPKNKKYLLVGIKIGWESAIGVNNWYYPDGNSLLNKPESADPKYGLKTDLLPDRGVRSIGYAAVSTLGLAKSGPLKEEHITEVVRLHLEDLCKLSADLGVPRDYLFTHCGGWSQGETLYTAALNKYCCPGWSFYKYAADPEKDITAMKALKKSDAPYWAAVEWLFMGKNTKEEWLSAINNSLHIKKVRYMCIYNWGGIRKNENSLSAIKEILKK
jgi:hypothetical protein